MLDQVRKQAVTRSSASLRGRHGPAAACAFRATSAVFAIGPDGTGSRDLHSLDLSEVQRFSSGVIQARSPTNLEQIAFRPARERLTFSARGQCLRVVNGLDATISALVYRTGTRRIRWTAPCRRVDKASCGRCRRGRDCGADDLPVSPGSRTCSRISRRGSYLAILERSPFWDPACPRRGARQLPPRDRLAGWPAMSAPMLQLDGLVRHFDDVRAVDDVSFSVERGKVLGFIGPNGAGKTTTMRILATLDTPQRGDARIGGYSVVDEPEKVRRIVGFMPDYAGVYANTTVSEYLDFFARAYDLRGGAAQRAVENIIEFMGIGELRDRDVESLSKGLKQRVALGRALIHDPQLLILDEPAANLDPRARIEFRTLIRELAADGRPSSSARTS